MNAKKNAFETDGFDPAEFITGGKQSVMSVRVTDNFDVADEDFKIGDIVFFDTSRKRPKKKDVLIVRDGNDSFRIGRREQCNFTGLYLAARDGKKVANTPKKTEQCLGVLTFVLRPVH